MRADPALTGRVIRFANMALNGPRRPVVSVADAIQRIGMSVVRQLVLGFAVLGHNRAAVPRVRAEIERKEFKTDHSELGAAMLEDWKLPRQFVEAIERHEDPDTASVTQGSRDYLLLHMLSLAAAIGTYSVSSESTRKAIAPDLVLAAAKIGLDADVLGARVDHVVAEWIEWGKILEVKTQDVAAFEQHAAKTTAVADPDRTKPHKGAGPMSILIADDDATIRIVLEQTLRQQGHKVVAAVNGREALKLAIEVNPQLVISDWVMVNDVHGHETGDRVLNKVAALLRQSARVEDVVGRLGGEEFVVVCPGANLAMGVRLAERLRQNLAQQDIQVGNVSMRITVSIGVSQQDATTSTSDEVMRRADAALYRAKRDGRNRVSSLTLGDAGAQAAK